MPTAVCPSLFGKGRTVGTPCNIPEGYCHCGCGQKTKIATKTVTRLGLVKGQPTRFIKGHNPARMRKNMVGYTRGTLRYIEEAEPIERTQGHSPERQGVFLCDPQLGGCGTTSVSRIWNVVKGNTQSCGCGEHASSIANLLLATPRLSDPDVIERCRKGLKEFRASPMGKRVLKRHGVLMRKLWQRDGMSARRAVVAPPIPRKVVHWILSQHYVKGLTTKQTWRALEASGMWSCSRSLIQQICFAAGNPEPYKQNHWCSTVQAWARSHQASMVKVKEGQVPWAKRKGGLLDNSTIERILIRRFFGHTSYQQIANAEGLHSATIKAICIGKEKYNRRYWYPWVLQWFKVNGADMLEFQNRAKQHKAEMYELKIKELMMGLEPRPRT